MALRCNRSVAVTDATPRLKDTAVLMTDVERGQGVAELVDLWLETDLAGVDEANSRQHVPLADGLALVPVRQSLLLTGTSGREQEHAGDGVLERLSGHDFQFVAMAPEGDYRDLGDAAAMGSANDATRAEEMLAVLRKTANSVAVNLLGMKLEDRPGCLAGLLPELLAHREWTGRLHYVTVGGAHHRLPATWNSGAAGLCGFKFVTASKPAQWRRGRHGEWCRPRWSGATSHQLEAVERPQPAACKAHEDVFGAPGHQSPAAE